MDGFFGSSDDRHSRRESRVHLCDLHMEIGSLRPLDRPAVEPKWSMPGVRVVLLGAGTPQNTPGALLDLIAWWEAKAAGGLPGRGALDPVEIGRHLSCIALLDVEEDDFRFRLAGEEVRARYGSLRGRSVRSALSGDARTETLAEHRACALGRRPSLVRRTGPTSDGSDERRYWRLLLPFGDEGRTTAILAGMHFE